MKISIVKKVRAVQKLNHEAITIKTIYISNLETELVLLKNLTTQDSLLLSYKNQEVQLLNEQIELYDKRLNQVDKWYNKPWIGVVGTILFLNAVDYTLPK